MPTSPGAADVLMVSTRLLIAGVLLRAAIGKFRTRTSAIIAVHLLMHSRSERLAPLITRCIAVAEIVLATALLGSIELRVTAVAVVVMMIFFSVALAMLRTRGLSEGCGCFGDKGPQEGSALARNAVLASGAGAVAVGVCLHPQSALPVWAVGVGQLLPAVLLAVATWLAWSVIQMLQHAFVAERQL